MSMTRVRERIAVGCPIAEAQSRLEAYFAKRRDPDGKTRLPLRIPLDGSALLKGLALEHDVAVVASRGRDEQNLNDVIKIVWEPEGGGAFPKFDGTLVVWAEHDPKESFIELDGTYTPPGGTSGEAFDETIGRAIARRTAHVLLSDIARAIADPKPAGDARIPQ